jgi:hypothetical protein
MKVFDNHLLKFKDRITSVMGTNVLFRESFTRLVFDCGRFVSGRTRALLRSKSLRKWENNLRQYRYKCAGWRVQRLTQKMNSQVVRNGLFTNGWILCLIVLLLAFFKIFELDLISSSKECVEHVSTSEQAGYIITGMILNLPTIRQWNVNANVAKNGEEYSITKHPIITENGEKQNNEKALPSSDACVGTSFRKQ